MNTFYRNVFVSVALMSTSVVSAEVLINEILIDPVGTDGTNEWLEICNNGRDPVDISRWIVESAGSNWSEQYELPSTIIPSGGYHLLDIGTFDSSFQNGGSATDGVRILDADSNVIDTVLYDSPNTNGLVDDLGSTSGPFAPDPSQGSTLAREVDCTETNNDSSDFIVTTDVSPGEENVFNGQSEDCENTVFSGAVINEVLYNSSGEWIEIFNTTDQPINVSGWSIEAGTSSFSHKGSFPNGTYLPPNGYLMIAEEEAVLSMVPDAIFSLRMGNGSSSIDGVRLVDCNSVTIDTVLYGNPATIGDWEDDNGSNPVSFAPKTSSGATIGRVPNGTDSNQSGSDFAILPFPTPLSANDAETDCDGQLFVKINEFLPNPNEILSDGTEITDDEGREWVELYNSSGSSVDLTGWKIQWGGTPSYSGGEFIIPNGTIIDGSGHLLLGGEYVEGADVVIPLSDDLDMTLASSNADAIRLMHCGPGVADTVVYGPNENGFATNPDEIQDDTENIATSAAPKPEVGRSIARLMDGQDTNQSALDFTIAEINTPGESNPEIVCGEGEFQVKINEIIPNPDGTDAGQEWVELYNVGSETIRLDGWSIETASSSWATKVTLPPATSIGSGEFFLIGEELVPTDFADVITEGSLSLGNASSGIDGVRLINCLGGIEDTLLYGELLAVPEEEELIDDLSNQSFAIMPDSGLSVGRTPDGSDTDYNTTDFSTNLIPTPRAPNATPGEDTDTDVDIPTKGCSREPDDADGEPSKCSHVSGVSPLIWMTTVFVLLRRRD